MKKYATRYQAMSWDEFLGKKDWFRGRDLEFVNMETSNTWRGGIESIDVLGSHCSIMLEYIARQIDLAANKWVIEQEDEYTITIPWNEFCIYVWDNGTVSLQRHDEAVMSVSYVIQNPRHKLPFAR